MPTKNRQFGHVARAKAINAEQEGLFVCDNAKPEMIKDLQEAGLRAIPCDKSASGKTID